MSIQDDIITALAGVALDELGNPKVFANAADEDIEPDLVIVRRIGYDREMTLLGPSGVAKSTYAFEGWSKTKDGAAALAQSVRAALDANTSLMAYPEPDPEEEYEPAPDEYVEPVYYSFWHDED